MNIRLYSILIISSFPYSCGNQSGYNYSKELPKNFNFECTWGMLEEYKINTYNLTLTKAISWDEDTVIHFELEKKQIEMAYQILVDIDILSYPDRFWPESNSQVLPSKGFSLEYEFNDIRRKIFWEENVNAKVRKAKNLRKFFEYIENIVIINQEVRNLPEDTRSFM